MFDLISWEFVWFYYLGVFLFGYLFGLILFGLVFIKVVGFGDICKIGFGNIGIINVLRIGNKQFVVVMFLGDGFKGMFVVVLVGGFYGFDFVVIVGFGVFFGYFFLVWLWFKGGKGVVIYLGILLGFFWFMFLIVVLIWIVMVVLFWYLFLLVFIMSLVILVFFYLVFNEFQFVEMFLVLSVLFWVKYYENIVWFVKGEESKIGLKFKLVVELFVVFFYDGVV